MKYDLFSGDLSIFIIKVFSNLRNVEKKTIYYHYYYYYYNYYYYYY